MLSFLGSIKIYFYFHTHERLGEKGIDKKEALYPEPPFKNLITTIFIGKVVLFLKGYLLDSYSDQRGQHNNNFSLGKGFDR